MQQETTQKNIRYAMAVTAVLGMVFMLYLTKLHYIAEESSFCDFGAGLSCQIVNQSIFSEVAGVPLSALGVIYFLSVVVVMLRKDGGKYLKHLLLFTVFSLVFSLYLSFIEWRVLNTMCVFCEGSKVLMLGIGFGTHRLFRQNAVVLARASIVAAVIAGALFSGMTHLLQIGWM